ncbi:MAG: YbaK/EbsC family protein [Alphaproteobacteria bacterium]|nr:YbaK/EbsC family protein [Alphaproteobacteria bacterium]
MRVRAALAAGGFASDVVTFPESTRTAAEAAAAIGCTVAQIAKSLVFRSRDTVRPVLVLASGVNRVDERKVAAALGEPIARADAEFVRVATGYAIGGVPPLAHATPSVVFVDAALAAHDPLWAAAGTPHAVFRTRFADLVRMTEGRVIAIA